MFFCFQDDQNNVEIRPESQFCPNHGDSWKVRAVNLVGVIGCYLSLTKIGRRKGSTLCCTGSPSVFFCQNLKHRRLFTGTHNCCTCPKKANFLLSTKAEVILLGIHLLKRIVMEKSYQNLQWMVLFFRFVNISRLREDGCIKGSEDYCWTKWKTQCWQIWSKLYWNNSLKFS